MKIVGNTNRGQETHSMLGDTVTLEQKQESKKALVRLINVAIWRNLDHKNDTIDFLLTQIDLIQYGINNRVKPPVISCNITYFEQSELSKIHKHLNIICKPRKMQYYLLKARGLFSSTIYTNHAKQLRDALVNLRANNDKLSLTEETNGFADVTSPAINDGNNKEISNVTYPRHRIKGGIIQHFHFESVKFNELDYRGVQHNSIRYTNCKFLECMLGQCAFSDTVFNNTTFCCTTRVNKSNALNGVTFNGCTVEHCAFTDLNAGGIKFQNTTISDTTFRNVNLNFLSVRGKVVFKNCNFTNISLSGADFTEAEFENCTFELDNDENRNAYSFGEKLKAICSINNKYSELKENLLRQLLEQYKNVNFISLSTSNGMSPPRQFDLIKQELDKGNIWCIKLLSEYFLNETQVYQQNCETMLNAWVSNYRISYTPIDVSKIEKMAKLLNSCTDDFKSEFMLKYNMHFNHMLYCLENVLVTNNNKELALSLRAHYVKIPIVYDKLKALSRTETDSDSINLCIQNFNEDGNYLFLVCEPNHGDLYHALELGSDFLAVHLYQSATSNIQWTSFFYVNTSNVLAKSPELESVFTKLFTIFSKQFMKENKDIKSKNIIDLLPLSAELKGNFHNAITTGKSDVKLVGGKDDIRINEEFSQLFQQSGNKSESAFTLEHLQVIYQALGITACDDQNKAQHLLVLAGIFTRLSSDSVFGVEGDSPFFLRCYALACINQANKLSPNVFPTTADSNVNSWRNKLMGWNDAFSCTAALSGKMYEHCKKNTCDVLDLWPLALRPPLYI